MTRASTAAFGMLMLLGLGSAAIAAPLPGPDLRAAASGIAIVHKVHGCHFDMGPNMAPDRQNGPHYHDRSCTVIPVGPPRRSYGAPRYDGYGPRRGPPAYAPPPQTICTEQCRYTGPIKRCRTVCR